MLSIDVTSSELRVAARQNQRYCTMEVGETVCQRSGRTNFSHSLKMTKKIDGLLMMLIVNKGRKIDLSRMERSKQFTTEPTQYDY